ncbi:hypothetical protein K503DRAFT_802094 [Rhizopogon vinicolor AM-OR11-026]|uniref:Uncharacterized protein n=1 Tax=Rhizopogon vinicolor AM-OR11-026 TaxID=1314800 RepID=A0A1B7MUQ2_9AGAM|nr:hypothetical protein K503DRAFT_802094 [Rhizopogon vinicolor AM-OR11-026]
MKFISRTTVILSAAAIVAAVDIQILGQPCAKANGAECGTIPGHNNGLPFTFLCGPKNTIILYEDCPCATCCEAVDDIAICGF